eukprot:gnl/MRDRNA2_/MRDRNA2_131088_c0_seq1.p1 gnl/MRDRNA2_/MRDRNA2_131088_c0~~gnl/MRDRNA2_/MRDRNA2_131088_c0_seq1.p1  ORF type:complete len:452 (-),score=62.65 gnl/MRDRNA2_/MRDRNA2_131088_c0_seq1:30-1331(-)
MFSDIKDSVKTVWMEFGFIDNSVSCMALCHAARDSIAQVSVLPPYSDIGCYVSGGETKCDVDLRPGVVAANARNLGDIPDLHDNELIASEQGSHKQIIQMQTEEQVKLSQPAYALQDSWEVLARLANLFRIFPISTISSDGKSGFAALLEVGETGFIEGIPNNRKQLDVYMQKIVLKAQSWVSLAIRQFMNKKTEPAMTRWFGSGTFSNEESRSQVQKILNSVNAALRKTAFRKGSAEECGTLSFAYTDLKRQKTWWSGHFIIYICDHFAEMSLDHQIETLVHEASHHAVAYTRDICVEYGRFGIASGCVKYAYGRERCQELAINSSEQAIKNADNFCYYVQEVVDFVACKGDVSCPSDPANPQSAAIKNTRLNPVCGLAVRNSMKNDMKEAHLTCKCRYSTMTLQGADPLCKGVQFDPAKLWGKGCFCASEL